MEKEPHDTSFDAEPSSKRARLSPGGEERPKQPVFIQPAPPGTNQVLNGLSRFSLTHQSTSKVSPASSSSYKAFAPGRRPSNLNLQNYPAGQHPAGLGIWVIQKLDHARKVNSFPRPSHSDWHSSPENFQTPHQGNGYSQHVSGYEPVAGMALRRWPFEDRGVIVDGHSTSQDEFDAARLQYQRDRKSKQRSENWPRNKENDVVARAKLEAKKNFPLETPESTKQEWIEKRIKDDLERLFNRLAGQFHSQMSHLAPFRPGFADTYFAADMWVPRLSPDVLDAGRLLSNVLPGLVEFVVTSKSEKPSTQLIKALREGKPHESSFFVAIRLLADNTDILAAAEKVLTILFAPKPESLCTRKQNSRHSIVPNTLPPVPTLQSFSSGQTLRRKEPSTLNSSSVLPPLVPKPITTHYSQFAKQARDNRQELGYGSSTINAHCVTYPYYNPIPLSPMLWQPHSYLTKMNLYSQSGYPETYNSTPLYEDHQHEPYSIVPAFGTPAFSWPPKTSYPSSSRDNQSRTSNCQKTLGFVELRPNLLTSFARQENSEPIKNLLENIELSPVLTLKKAKNAPILVHLASEMEADTQSDFLLSTVAENARPSEKSGSLSVAPATPATSTIERASTNLDVSSHAINTSRGGGVHNVRLKNRENPESAAQSATIEIVGPALQTSSRFPVRDRKPTARAAAAQIAPRRYRKTKKSSQTAEIPSTEMITTTAALIKDSTSGTPQQDRRVNDTLESLEAVHEPEAKENFLPRLSGREMTSTAKVTELTKGFNLRKGKALASGNLYLQRFLKVDGTVQPNKASRGLMCASPVADVELSSRSGTSALASTTSKKVDNTAVGESAIRATVSEVAKIPIHKTTSPKITLRLTKRSDYSKQPAEEISPRAMVAPPKVDQIVQIVQSPTKHCEKALNTDSLLFAYACIAADDPSSNDDFASEAERDEAMMNRWAEKLSQFPNLEVNRQPSRRSAVGQEHTVAKSPAEIHSGRNSTALGGSLKRQHQEAVPDQEKAGEKQMLKEARVEAKKRGLVIDSKPDHEEIRGKIQRYDNDLSDFLASEQSVATMTADVPRITSRAKSRPATPMPPVTRSFGRLRERSTLNGRALGVEEAYKGATTVKKDRLDVKTERRRREKPYQQQRPRKEENSCDSDIEKAR